METTGLCRILGVLVLGVESLGFWGLGFRLLPAAKGPRKSPVWGKTTFSHKESSYYRSHTLYYVSTLDPLGLGEGLWKSPFRVTQGYVRRSPRRPLYSQPVEDMGFRPHVLT